MIKKIFFYLFKTRFLYSVYVNFRYLPFRDAIRLPLFFYPKASIKMGKSAELIVKRTICRIFIGGLQTDFQPNRGYTTIINNGSLTLEGGASIWSGSVVYVFVSGRLTLKNDVFISINTKIVCSKEIIIGAYTRIAHECQVFDTNFHYIEDTVTGNINKISRPISIGQYCWIANRTTIGCGAVLPDYTIMASNSLVNKDLSSFGTHALWGGTPAKYIKSNVIRVFDPQREKELFATIDNVIMI